MRSAGKYGVTVRYCIALCAYTLVKVAGEVLRALLPTSMELKFQLDLLLRRNRVNIQRL